MPEVKKILDSFKKQYGERKGINNYFAWKKEKPVAFKKGLKTAIKKGDKIVNNVGLQKTKVIKTAKKK